VAIRDYREIAQKYKGISDFQMQVSTSPKLFQVGDQQKFTILNDDTEEKSTITATLQYETDHVYFWTEKQIKFNLKDIEALCNDFEDRIYPTDRSYFGNEWSPGIDNDAHLYIVYTGGLGTYVGGYFSSEDEVAREVNPDSNMHEMFFVNADGQDLASSYMYSLFAHEFTHMIQYNHQRNEETWWSEGSAQLAEYLNGTTQGWEGYFYLSSPDIPLTKWTDDMSQADPYYAGAYLFLAYLYERFGSTTMQKIIQSDATGMSHLDSFSQSNGIVDPNTGKILSSVDVFGDWEVANLINDSTIDNGQFGYKNMSLPGTIDVTETVSACPLIEQSRSVNQYGTDFIEITCEGSHTISFAGENTTKIVSADPHSGNEYFWSNIGNESSMTLTHEFDLTQVNGKIEMNFWNWYDLEKEYDYIYFLASTDGTHWQVLKPGACIDGKNSYACGITGKNSGWVKDSVDLSAYAGMKVMVQIDYQTDLAINGEGYLIDDISIPAINYFTDFETDEGGWVPEGFVRISNAIPQTFVLSLVNEGNQTTVKRIQLSSDQTATIDFNLQSTQKAILIVSAATRFTQIQALYKFQIVK
jgi:hypothetical protein